MSEGKREKKNLAEVGQAIHKYCDFDENRILIGFIVVAEFVGNKSMRSLVRFAGSGTDGEENTTSWQRKGYLTEGLDDIYWDDNEDNEYDTEEEDV